MKYILRKTTGKPGFLGVSGRAVSTIDKARFFVDEQEARSARRNGYAVQTV